MPPRKYHNLAEALLATARSGFELYKRWYQSQQSSRKRKRSTETTITTSTCSSADDKKPTVVCLDSSDENDETQSSSSAGRLQTKRQKLERKVAIQRFPIGTLVRKVGKAQMKKNAFVISFLPKARFWYLALSNGRMVRWKSHQETMDEVFESVDLLHQI